MAKKAIPLSHLRPRLRMTAETIGQGVNRLKRTVSQSALRELVNQTPVDTGVARGSWNVSTGAPVFVQRAPGDRTGALAIRRGNAVIRSATGGTAKKPTSDAGVIHITNGATHIAELNRGKSRQAPAGFIERAIYAAKGVLKGTRLLVKDFDRA